MTPDDQRSDGTQAFRRAGQDRAGRRGWRALPLYRAVDVENGGFTLLAFLNKRKNTGERCGKILFVFKKRIRPGIYRVFRKRRNVLEMVIKSIPVYMTAVNDIVDRYFIVWFFLQQCEESIAEDFFGSDHAVSCPFQWDMSFLSEWSVLVCTDCLQCTMPFIN